MPKRAFALSLTLAVIGILIIGCTKLTPIVVTPTSAMVGPGGTVNFTAADHQGNPVTVTWSVTSGLGTVTSASLYTAPLTVASVTNATVTATLASNPSITSSGVVTLNPPARATLVDPVGDTFLAGTYDIIKVTTARTATDLSVIITFNPATPPSIPPAGRIRSSRRSGWLYHL